VVMGSAVSDLFVGRFVVMSQGRLYGFIDVHCPTQIALVYPKL
jgi:hypothetical protein